MSQHPGYYTRQIVKLQKELHAKQAQLQAQQEINDGLRWKEWMLKGAFAAMAAGVKAVKPASGQSSSCCSPGQTPANGMQVKAEPFAWQPTTASDPAAVLLDSSSYCQQDASDADAASSGSSTLDAALESAIFSALDADSSTDIFFSDPKTAALNHLMSQLATTELEVQSTLLQLGCSEVPGERLYTSQLLQQLLANGGPQRLQAAAELPADACLLQLAAAVKQMSCLLPRYEDDNNCQVSAWSARSQLDCLVDMQVQSAIARGVAGKPCDAVKHMAVNMETLTQQAYPDGWFARVSASLQLTAEQKAVLRAVWAKVAADRVSLLTQHEALLTQLLQMQQQQATAQQVFGLRVQQASQRCVASMRKQAWKGMPAFAPPAAAAGGDGSVSVQAYAGLAIKLAGEYSISSGSLDGCSPRAMQAGALKLSRTSTPTAGCSSSSSSASTSSAAAAAAFCSNTASTCGQALQQQQQQSGSVQAGCVAAALDQQVLSMTCSAQGPDTAAGAAAAAADAFSLAFQPEVLMCQPLPGQQQLQQKLTGLRAAFGVTYTWASLVLYNTLSRKQLAVGLVTSYPFAFDPVAVCEAVGVLPMRKPAPFAVQPH